VPHSAPGCRHRKRSRKQHQSERMADFGDVARAARWAVGGGESGLSGKVSELEVGRRGGRENLRRRSNWVEWPRVNGCA